MLVYVVSPLLLYKRWTKGKKQDHMEMNEYSAFERYIHQMDTGNYLVSLHDGNRMIGFASFEILNEKYAICHFAKAEKVYKGVYDSLNYYVGQKLKEYNIRYWNFEQDLGIPGLRQSKRKYKPEFYLKKCIVGLKNE